MLVCVKSRLLLNQYLPSKDPTKDDSKGTTWTLSQCLEPSEPRITFQSIQSNTGSCLGPRYKAKIFFPEVCSQQSIGRVSREPTFSLSLSLSLSPDSYPTDLTPSPATLLDCHLTAKPNQVINLFFAAASRLGALPCLGCWEWLSFAIMPSKHRLSRFFNSTQRWVFFIFQFSISRSF